MERETAGESKTRNSPSSAQLTTASLRSRISNVRYTSLNISLNQSFESIDFELDGKPYRGDLKGRLKDVVIGFDARVDLSIAVMSILDKQSYELTVDVAL